LKAPHSKCGIRVTVSGVRIPPSPPISSRLPFAHTRHCPQKSPPPKALASITVYVWRTMYANIRLFVMGMMMGN
jgi:hypothetical protein